MRSLAPDSPLGRHLLADFQGVAAERLADAQFIEARMLAAAHAAGASPLFSKFHQFGIGLGITGVLLLKESHISIHTWPEFGFAAVDVFMCGDCRPERAVEVLRDALQPITLRLKDQVRGMLDSEPLDLTK
jgi:S-adenosylmethionine decarboxylase